MSLKLTNRFQVFVSRFVVIAMSKLRHGFVLLMKRNPDGSHATQAARAKILTMIEKQLKQDGYRHLTPQTLKLKHVNHLVNRWQGEGLSAGTIKNRVAHVRWAFEKAGRAHLVPKLNDSLGIERRQQAGNDVNKAKPLDATKHERITDPYVKASLELQAAFGLRREEAIKFSPSYADQGDLIRLKDSWTKGGKPRVIPVRNEQQRAVLERVKSVAGRGALIPRGSNYKDQLKTYENQCSNVGLSKNHGLRHEYAQQRYLELTGRAAPKAGGLTSKELTPEQKEIDQEARMTISKELGHERESITVTYLGR